MGQVNIDISGRKFTLACGDGEEPRLTAMAKLVSDRVSQLRQQIGSVGEDRLLAIAAIMFADELTDMRDGNVAAAPPALDHSADIAAIDAAAERLESLAVALAER